MRNRKLIAALSAALCLSLAACSAGGNQKPQESENASQNAPVETKDSEKDTKAPSESDKNEAKPEETTAPTTEAPTETETETQEAEAENMPLDEILAGFEEKEIGKASLKEIGSFDGKGISFKGDNIYSFKEDEEVVLHDYLGNVLLDDKAEYVEKLGDTGLYTYRAKGDGEDATIYSGLIDAQGNEILSADEKVGMFEKLDGDRFVMAFFPEGETDNKEEAIYYATKRQYALDVKDDDVMYTGKVKVYDTKERKFLENTTESYAPRYSVNGDIISYNDPDYNTIVVTADDKKLELDEDLSVVGTRLYTRYKNDKTYAYDHDMNLMFTTPYSVSAMNNTDDLYVLYDTDNKTRGVIHYTGTVLIEPKYYGIDYLGGGYLSYESTDDYSKKGIADLTGKEYTKDEYKYITYLGVPGVFDVSDQDGKHSLINVKTDKTIDEGAAYSYKIGEYVSDKDGYPYFVINKDDLALNLETYGTNLGNYMVSDFKAKAAYDLVDGEKIVEGYEKIYSAFGYLYVLKDGKYTVYEVER